MKEECFYKLKDKKEKEILEENFEIIKKEVLNLPEEAYNAWHESNINNGLWYMFPISLLHVFNPYAKEYLPKTVELISKLGSIQSSISVLRAGAEIYPHTDILSYDGKEDILISRETYRMQLGISIPNGDCKIAVQDQNGEFQWSEWKKGKVTCINDSWLHKAHNKTNEDRIVLIVDIPKENAVITEERLNDIMMHFAAEYPELLN